MEKLNISINSKIKNLSKEEQELENAMIKELKKDSDSIVNQMKIGMTPNIVDITEFKKNNTFNKQNVFHEENTVKNILKNSVISLEEFQEKNENFKEQ